MRVHRVPAGEAEILYKPELRALEWGVAVGFVVVVDLRQPLG